MSNRLPQPYLDETLVLGLILAKIGHELRTVCVEEQELPKKLHDLVMRIDGTRPEDK